MLGLQGYDNKRTIKKKIEFQNLNTKNISVYASLSFFKLFQNVDENISNHLLIYSSLMNINSYGSFLYNFFNMCLSDYTLCFSEINLRLSYIENHNFFRYFENEYNKLKNTIFNEYEGNNKEYILEIINVLLVNMNESNIFSLKFKQLTK